MSKQVRIMDNIELAVSSSERSTKARSNLSSMPRKYKALLLVAGVLAALVVGLLVAIAVGASVIFSHSDSHHPGDPMIDEETRMELLKQVAESKSAGIAKRQAERNNLEASCYSIRTNETHPAAHISGKGFKWTGLEPGSPVPESQDFGYQSSWVCANKSDAFVDGGMYFNQKNKRLYAPTCGYYYVSSQVFFQSDVYPSQQDAASSSKYVRHQLRIERNCSSLTDRQNRVILRSYSSFPRNPGSVTRTTTNIGDVVKLCAGGNIYVEIPGDRYNPCCPFGRYQSTYLSAFMVSETSCEPSVPLSHPPDE